MSCDDFPDIYRHLPWDEQILLHPDPGETIDITGFIVELTLTNLADPGRTLTLTTADSTIEIYEPIGNADQDAVIVTRCPQPVIGALPWGAYQQEIRFGIDGAMTALDPATRRLSD